MLNPHCKARQTNRHYPTPLEPREFRKSGSLLHAALVPATSAESGPVSAWRIPPRLAAFGNWAIIELVEQAFRGKQAPGACRVTNACAIFHDLNCRENMGLRRRSQFFDQLRSALGDTLLTVLGCGLGTGC